MSVEKLFTHLVRASNGAWSTAYGPFVIKTALQPLFRVLPGGMLDLDSFQGLVRPERDGDAFPPSEFFPLVDPADRPGLESLMRTIHILNAGALRRHRARIFVNFDPRIYGDERALRHEIERMRLAAHEGDMTPDRIVCELPGRTSGPAFDIDDCAARLRATGMRIALCDYGAGEMDAECVASLRPDYVKFDSHWVRDYMTNPAGFALLKVIVRQFNDSGVQAIFERLEESWQVDLCRELGVPLIQGYALARPQTAPTDFDAVYPEMLLPPAAPERLDDQPAAPIAHEEQPPLAPRDRRTNRAPAFGRRQA